MICETSNMIHAAPMPKKKRVVVADLFCGAGGTTTGVKEAIEEAEMEMDLTGINHEPIAIATFKENHPNAQAHIADLFQANPLQFFKRGQVDILVGSPECRNHSVARGGMPINEQSRATAHCCTLWLERLGPPVFIFENVREFRDWGPLGADNKPLKSRKGETFNAWIKLIESLGYRVDYRLMRAADYGDPTSRVRLFIVGVRGRRPIPWPAPTHAKDPTLLGLKPWRAAREIIDWKLQGKSIFNRNHPYAVKTLRRVIVGLKEFGLAPFIVPQHQGGRPVHSVNDPLAAIQTTSRGIGLSRPSLDAFIVPHFGENKKQKPRAHSVDKPLPTVTGQGAGELVQPGLRPFIVPNEGYHGGNAPRSIDEPLNTVTAERGAGRIAQPFLIKLRGTNNAADIDNPTPTVTTGNNLGLAQAFLVSTAHGNGPEEAKADKRRAKSIDEPLPTVAGNRGDFYVAHPFIIPIDHQSSDSGIKSPEEPLSTITTKQRHALIDPYLLQYYGSSMATPVTKPMPTVTCRDRFALGEAKLSDEPALLEANRQRVIAALFRWCDDVLAALLQITEKKAKAHIRQPIFQVEQDGKTLLIPLDILLRMLNWRELAAAQGFPRDYKFKGNSTQIVKMIGNAVPKNLAKALGRAALEVL